MPALVEADLSITKLIKENKEAAVNDMHAHDVKLHIYFAPQLIKVFFPIVEMSVCCTMHEILYAIYHFNQQKS